MSITIACVTLGGIVPPGVFDEFIKCLGWRSGLELSEQNKNHHRKYAILDKCKKVFFFY